MYLIENDIGIFDINKDKNKIKFKNKSDLK